MKKFVIFLLMVLITGCISRNSGNQNLSTALIQQSITAGKTTKQDVRDVFGEPVTVSTISTGQVVSNPAAREMWSYYKSTYEGGPGPEGYKLFVLAVYFNQDGTVVDYVITEKK